MSSNVYGGVKVFLFFFAQCVYCSDSMNKGQCVSIMMEDCTLILVLKDKRNTYKMNAFNGKSSGVWVTCTCWTYTVDYICVATGWNKALISIDFMKMFMVVCCECNGFYWISWTFVLLLNRSWKLKLHCGEITLHILHKLYSNEWCYTNQFLYSFVLNIVGEKENYSSFIKISAK